MIQNDELSMESITNEILITSKIRARKLNLELNPVEINSLINISVDSFKAKLLESDIRLKLLLSTSPLETMCDKNKIEDLVTSLIDNAIKFTPKAGVISISSKKVDDNIVVSVKDSGIGIKKENLNKLFAPFFQVSSDLTRKYRGVGLGLTVAKGIVESHKGTIKVMSDGLGKGSTFEFSIPIISK